MTPTENTLVLAFITTIFSATVAYLFVSLRKRQEANDQRDKEIAGIKWELQELRVTAKPITDAMTQMLVDKLTHFHTPELDDLMARRDHLTPTEVKRMEQLLEEREVDMHGEIDDAERLAAKMLPLAIQLGKLEAIKAPPQLEAVMVLLPVSESSVKRENAEEKK